MTKRAIILTAAACCMMTAFAQTTISYSWNPKDCILPSSRWTPEHPYSASVWVFNEGERYQDSYYNHVWATPSDDAEGHHWYEPDYQLTDDGIAWQSQTAPFSSDEYYMNKKSFRWILPEITGEIYIRRAFTLTDERTADPNFRLYLACGHDDAPAEFYINGELIFSASDGWNNDEYRLLSSEQMALIRTDGSENILAVHVHQNWGGAYADCGLYAASLVAVEYLLPTVRETASWPCKYYYLNRNDDIAKAEGKSWASLQEDESDWISGVGPFSNDENMFLVTQWPSRRLPLLVRRHFTLTSAQLASLTGKPTRIYCSYDENPKVYLNGDKIWENTGWNDNNYAEINLSERQKRILHEGDNVLAVSLTSGEGGGHVDFGICIEYPYEYSAVNTPMAESDHCPDTRIFSLTGMYMGTTTDTLSAGIYIRDGKKFIVK